MAISPADMTKIEAFRNWLEEQVAATGRFGPAMRIDRDDRSSLMMRFPAGANLWLEIAVRPHIPQIRAGILTDDRWKSEELEEAIEATGDTMSEFIEAGFDEVDLDWSEPPVEHYREGGRYFYFATPLELRTIADLDRADIRQKALRMVMGYAAAFSPALQKKSS